MQISEMPDFGHENTPTLKINSLKRENKELKEEIKKLKRQLAYYQSKRADEPEVLLEDKERKRKTKEQKTAARNALARLLATNSPVTRKELRAWNDNTHKLKLADLAAIINFLDRKGILIKDRYKNYWHFSCR